MIFIKGEGEKKRITTEISGSPTEIIAELTMAIRGAREILKQGLPMYDLTALSVSASKWEWHRRKNFTIL